MVVLQHQDASLVDSLASTGPTLIFGDRPSRQRVLAGSYGSWVELGTERESLFLGARSENANFGGPAAGRIASLKNKSTG